LHHSLDKKSWEVSFFPAGNVGIVGIVVVMLLEFVIRDRDYGWLTD